jgi:hypothetical protein
VSLTSHDAFFHGLGRKQPLAFDLSVTNVDKPPLAGELGL